MQILYVKHILDEQTEINIQNSTKEEKPKY
jgi:hypothetical protein